MTCTMQVWNHINIYRVARRKHRYKTIYSILCCWPIANEKLQKPVKKKKKKDVRGLKLDSKTSV